MVYCAKNWNKKFLDCYMLIPCEGEKVPSSDLRKSTFKTSGCLLRSLGVKFASAVMGMSALWLVLFSTLSVGVIKATDDFQPQQVHIALADNNRDIVVTWVTMTETKSTVVEYGTSGLSLSATGSATKFTDGGSLQREMWMHRVRLPNLTDETRYFYHCGSDLGWSAVFTFKTLPPGSDWELRTAVYGDMGVVNAQSLGRLQEDVSHGAYDMIIHVGDFGYDLDSDNALIGDAFMRVIEPVAAYVPYMTCPGNHENAYNFSNYKARFTMPRYEDSESMYFSWNSGPVHFVSVNTEAYYYLNYGSEPLQCLWNWLVEDLEEAVKPENREQRPWIILFGHRPMYCSSSDGDDCSKEECSLRVGISDNYAMEELLKKYGVDLAIWAHEHNYERLFPIYDYKILNGTTEEPYTNPKAPVHITTGSAGCQEDHDPFQKDQPDWCAFRSLDYGYSRMTVYNATHLYWDQVSDDQDGAVIDSMWLIKDTHGPYEELYPEYY